MSRGVRQRLDDLEELDHRARPAVRDEDWERVRLSRADVQKVNGEAVDLRAELRKAIQPGLTAAPVIPGPPILHQRLHLRDGHALRPVGHRLRVRPARLRQTPLQVVEGASRRAVAEGRDRRAGARERAPRARQSGRGGGRGGQPAQHGAARQLGPHGAVTAPLRSDRLDQIALPVRRDVAGPSADAPYPPAIGPMRSEASALPLAGWSNSPSRSTSSRATAPPGGTLLPSSDKRALIGASRQVRHRCRRRPG